VVAVPLGVVTGLKEPQAPLLLQVTLHMTPPFLVSLVTAAVRLAVALAATEAGGLLIVTEIAGAVTLMVAVADAAVPEEVVAVMVTLCAEEGAV
jgi:hypothetical protein